MPHQSLPADQAPPSIWRGLRQTLQKDTVGGAFLLTATLLALIVANSPASALYTAVRDVRFGPEALHLELSVGSWAADGLLAIFFFVVGLELKEEFVVGKLRDPRTALVPIVAAVGGVAVPALIFTAVNLPRGGAALEGWAIPAATDIAFAVAVIAVVGRFLPPALRTFLLTLAVVDDLIAITIIAVFYAAGIDGLMLALALVPLAVFAVCVQRGVRAWWVLIPLGVATWALVHASGIHATVAGVLLGFTVPVVATTRARVQVGADAEGRPVCDGLAAHFADRWSVLSTAVAVPVFAFFSAGVTLGGVAGLVDSFQDSIAVGIIAGLVLGKPLGIAGSTFLLTRFRGIGLDPTLRWIDVIGMAFVAGIGFTVSLLVGELSFGAGSESDDHVKVGVLAGSFLAAVIGGAILVVRNRHYRRLGG
ncbi:Na+/H+ antiporter NhaA [Rathayibacter rathayi]|uniref:Na+/H+ antiporter NhaA n=1 Tax=Rathayibacter rathayi TaxID=33887 RepID=UPI000CE83320|nr:Na+/H+ antiporter NhaA [Rathayibacter rathayi]PPG69239.1 Na+/H+ antiporter NhaA [Rathayibacter rathayi]PPG74094.1 Na+/H+ antiporter NhaA [Rathayibacter rathayi]PPH23195.1 Na+/H+ antiporter NhaA [Rathayibacter rathayi]PPI78315.1 Na+/H+ antiporter NhaA [Rathayibacter rathayi]